MMFSIKNNAQYEEVVRLEDALPELDILYMTRVQKERFFNEEDYVRMKDFYILDAQKMELAPDRICYVLHPLPRVNEIAVEVDDDPRAAYFSSGSVRRLCIRMALILTLLEIEVVRRNILMVKNTLNVGQIYMKDLFWITSKQARSMDIYKYLQLRSTGLLCCNYQKCKK